MTARHRDTRLPFETPPTRRRRFPTLLLCMIGLITGFGAVYWSLQNGSTLKDGDITEDLVARGVQVPLAATLPEPQAAPVPAPAIDPVQVQPKPAQPLVRILAPAPVRPVLRPADLNVPANLNVPDPVAAPTAPIVARAAPVPQQAAPAPQAAARVVSAPQPPEPINPDPAPAPQAAAQGEMDSGFDLMRRMSFGLIGEPVQDGPAPDMQPTPRVIAAPEPEPTPEPALPDNLYVVQEGDSLHGITFRSYGSTGRYLDILQANSDLISHPSDLRAGMVLTIPE